MFQTFDDHADPSFGQKHLPLIRAELARQGLDGVLVPHEDEHNNEYLPEANDRLAFATGFTGSAGAAVVLSDKAAVFVDGRYTLQVRAQVDGALFSFHDLVEGEGDHRRRRAENAQAAHARPIALSSRSAAASRGVTSGNSGSAVAGSK